MTKKKKKKHLQRLPISNQQYIKKEVRRLANNQLADIRLEIKNEMLDIIIPSLLLALHDEFDFGAKRLLRAYKRFLAEFDALYEGRQSIEDVNQVLWEECKIKINMVEGDVEND